MSLYTAVMIYLMIGWRRAAHQASDIPKSTTAAISLTALIPFRNEQVNLPALLEDLESMGGDISLLHIILIDDHSSDDTLAMVHPFLKSKLNLELLTSNGEGKIAALRTGLAKVKSDHVITLDADIRLNPRWLVYLSSIIRTDVDMCILPVLGTTDGSLPSRYSQLDFMSLIGTTFSMAAHSHPVLANGAQLLIKTASIHWQEGIVSGDDVFALHAVKQAGGRISYELNKDLIAKTSMPNTWKAVWTQRKRWASKSLKYNDRDTTLLGTLVLTVNVGLWVLLCYSIYNREALSIFLTMLLIKAIIDLVFLTPVMRWFGQGKNLMLFPLAFCINFLQYPLIFIAGQLSGFTWKERHYKP